jgi:AcrR family transcriptional regulator
MGAIAASVDVSLEDRVLDAAKACCERWGRDKVTVDDIARESGCSRATIYRLFPGGRDYLFEGLRVRETTNFFTDLTAHMNGAVGFEAVVVCAIVEATRALKTDEHLQLMLASQHGEVAQELTIDGLPRIVSVATAFLSPWFAPYIGDERSAELAEWLSRVVISYFLAPSTFADFTQPESAHRFVQRFVLPAFPPNEPSLAKE